MKRKYEQPAMTVLEIRSEGMMAMSLAGDGGKEVEQRSFSPEISPWDSGMWTNKEEGQD